MTDDLKGDLRGQRVDVEIDVGDWNPFEETNPTEVLRRLGAHLMRLATENAVRRKTEDLVGFIVLLPNQTEVHVIPRDESILRGLVNSFLDIVCEPAGPDALWIVVQTPRIHTVGRLTRNQRPTGDAN